MHAVEYMYDLSFSRPGTTQLDQGMARNLPSLANGHGNEGLSGAISGGLYAVAREGSASDHFAGDTKDETSRMFQVSGYQRAKPPRSAPLDVSGQLGNTIVPIRQQPQIPGFPPNPPALIPQ